MPPARVKAAADAWPTNSPFGRSSGASHFLVASATFALLLGGCEHAARLPGTAHHRGRRADQRDGPGRPMVSRRVYQTNCDEGGDVCSQAGGHRVRRHRGDTAFAPCTASSQIIPSTEMVKGVTVKERASRCRGRRRHRARGKAWIVCRRPGPARIRVLRGTAFPIEPPTERSSDGSVEKRSRSSSAFRPSSAPSSATSVGGRRTFDFERAR